MNKDIIILVSRIISRNSFEDCKNARLICRSSSSDYDINKQLICWTYFSKLTELFTNIIEKEKAKTFETVFDFDRWSENIVAFDIEAETTILICMTTCEEYFNLKSKNNYEEFRIETDTEYIQLTLISSVYTIDKREKYKGVITWKHFGSSVKTECWEKPETCKLLFRNMEITEEIFLKIKDIYYDSKSDQLLILLNPEI